MNERDPRAKPRDILEAEKRLPRDIKAVITAEAAEVAVDIRELYQRIEELERRPFLNEAGVWEAGKAYGVGMVVSDHGSAWVCKAPTWKRPGDSSDWRLLVKKGRDGKDAAKRIIGQIK